MTATVAESAPLEQRSSEVKRTGLLGRFVRRWLPLIVLVVILAITWEVIKLVGGQVWKIDIDLPGQSIHTTWKPPLKFQFANDLNMPHLWEMVDAFNRPAQRGGPPMSYLLVNAALFTFRVALLGFLLGSSLGLILAIILIHSRLLNRALVPYIVASQTVPILVIAPMVVIWLRAGWFSIVIIAAYLSFFPVTVSALRGLQSASPEMLELMRTYAASNRQILLKLRLQIALPYLFVGLKIAATASVIGTIVGELPSGISQGLGSLILNFAQYYSTGPAKLWACILVVGTLGISTFLIVQVAELLVLRRRVRPSADVL